MGYLQEDRVNVGMGEKKREISSGSACQSLLSHHIPL
jgi:hypothetical protein